MYMYGRYWGHQFKIIEIGICLYQASYLQILRETESDELLGAEVFSSFLLDIIFWIYDQTYGQNINRHKRLVVRFSNRGVYDNVFNHYGVGFPAEVV